MNKEINGASLISKSGKLIDNEIIISTGIKLSKVLDWMPYGIIDKRITGIGATTLELLSKRNSIIVEPIKAIASSKAKMHGAQYVGGKLGGMERPTDSQIKNYTSSNIDFKKIVVVADSLPRVISAIGNQVYGEYFIMIDEIDTFQIDSLFRKNLEKTIDYYLKFDGRSRCLVSATILDFSHPEIKQEPHTIIRYQKEVRRDITVINSSDPILSTKHAIERIRNKSQKVLVAINYIEGAKKVISLLGKEKESCKILCSENSSDSAEEYFAHIDNGKLPGRINFMTSAYFTGIDLYDRYHLISVADIGKTFTLLSLEKLNQIQGRARNGVLSETVIHNYTTSNKKYSLIPIEELVNEANNTLQALLCVNLAYKDSTHLLSSLERIRDALAATAKVEDGELVRRDIDNNFQISYLNIDAINERIKMYKNLYSNPMALSNALRKHHNVKFFNETIKKSSKQEQIIAVVKATSRKQRNEEIEKSLKELDELEGIFTEQMIQRSEGVTRILFEQFAKLIRILDHKDAIDRIRKSNINMRDSRAFNNLWKSAEYEALVDKHPFKRMMKEEFPIESKFTAAEIQKLINKVYTNVAVGFKPVLTEHSAVQELRSYFEVRRQYSNSTGTVHRIVGTNPKQIKVKTRISELFS